jgi:hypothetical protein
MIEDSHQVSGGKHNNRFSFRVLQSVPLPPSMSILNTSGRYARDHMPLVGFIYHTTEKSGELKMTYTCSMDKTITNMIGEFEWPSWAANSAIQSHIEKCFNRTLLFLEVQRAKRDTFVLPTTVISPSYVVLSKVLCVKRK